MKKYKVKIKGNTPYMQNKMNDEKLDEREKNRGFIIENSDVALEDQERAWNACYHEDGQPYIPSEHIRGAMINAGKMVKAKVGSAKRSMKNIVAAMFFVTPEKILLPKKFDIDKRSAVNQNIKGRVTVIRPKWTDWNAEFELMVDNDTITDETIKQILKNAGQYVGIGSFNPLHNGMYGRFEIEEVTKIT